MNLWRRWMCGGDDKSTPASQKSINKQEFNWKKAYKGSRSSASPGTSSHRGIPAEQRRHEADWNGGPDGESDWNDGRDRHGRLARTVRQERKEKGSTAPAEGKARRQHGPRLHGDDSACGARRGVSQRGGTGRDRSAAEPTGGVRNRLWPDVR
ncbi:hypothetical protein PIB30_065991 [Stylosanthes scabra]|uniref:Uncharacterized protein n=1 Tax=Stylosanthes scabra TaxID=79078 RepID=A0ABU6QLY5_9FABA|nr:hypothetical protein [Stylosanthes scabra]